MIEAAQNLYAAEELCDHWLKILRPPPRLSVSEWAETYRELSRESSSKAGKFRAYPFQKAMLDDACDPNIQSATWMIASQICKTETINCVAGYFIHQDPSPMLCIQPTLEMGTTWSKDRLAPMLRDTQCLRGLVKDARSRDSGTTMLHKVFPGGHITVCGANSPASLASRPIRVLLCDEIDRYPDSAGEEGDPTSLAVKRTETFWNAVKIFVSTPTIKGLSKIEKMYDGGDKQLWFVRCLNPACQHEQTLKWPLVKWSEEWKESQPVEAWYECEKCNHKHTDADRRKMIERGRWVATNPDASGKRSRHLNGLYSLAKAQKGFKTSLHKFVVDAVDAEKGGTDSRRAWVNTFLAETFDPMDATEKPPEWKTIADRREEYTGIPQQVVFVTGYIDCQKNRLEIEYKGWGKNERSWGIEHLIIDGKIKDWQVWKDLHSEFKTRKFVRADGAQIELTMCLIDGGHWGDEILKFLYYLNHTDVIPGISGNVRATKGEGRHNHPIIDTNWRAVSKNLRGYHIGTWAAKDLINHRLRLLAPKEGEDWPEGYMHFPKSYDEPYFQQLCTGKVTIVYDKGEEIRKFLNEEKLKDEGLDLSVGNLAALRLRRRNFEAEEAKLLATIPQKEQPKPEGEENGSIRPTRSFVGVSSWRI
jgi:phage terminase large subunit GpA-like protein